MAGATYFARAGISLTHPSSGVPFPLLRFGVPFTQIFGPRRGLGGWCATRLARHLAGGTARVRCPFSLFFLRKTIITGYHAAFAFYTWASERVPAFLAVILGVHLFYSDFGWALLRFFFVPSWPFWRFCVGGVVFLDWHYSDFGLALLRFFLFRPRHFGGKEGASGCLPDHFLDDWDIFSEECLLEKIALP